tara:strand:- start:2155 stop:3078 length:924 start_codon:yes stop_codon:yes gene_type:complete
MKPILLVVGGTGFIGYHVAKRAMNEGFDVYSISRNPPIPLREVKGVEYNFFDLLNNEHLKKFLNDKEFNYVVNTSGCINHQLFIDGGNKVFENHFFATKNLIHFLNRKKLKSFIHLGSSDEYGDNISPISEIQRESPISPYSFAKVATSHMLQMLQRTEQFPAVILRLFLVYGPTQDKERFLPNLIINSLRNNDIPITFGEQLRDFCYVNDVVNAIFLSFDKENALGNIINIASGDPIKIKEMVIRVNSLIQKGKPLFGSIKYRTNESMSLYADIRKAKKVLNWKPTYKIEHALKETVNWYKENGSY